MAEAAADAPARKAMRKRDEKRRGIRWDEATIAEHDKERGTRMKIIEPKTPYHAPGSPSADASADAPPPTSPEVTAQPVSASVLHAELEAAQGEAEDPDKKPTFALDTEELEESRAAKRQRDFKSKRAAHYNEFLRAKELAAKAALEDEDEEGEGEGEEGGGGGGDGEVASGSRA